MDSVLRCLRCQRADVKFERSLELLKKSPVITMLGYGGIAHGYDRAIEVIANLDFDAELWLVGADESNARKANLMAKEYGVQSLVRTFPWMRGGSGWPI